MKIAIIGAGLSGASVLRTILEHPNFNEEDQIDVFEPRELLGVGLPYDSDDESIMLNVSPDILSYDQTKPDDFVEWLHENYEDPYNFEGLISRPKYGRYLAERFAPYFEHEQVTHQQVEVEDVKVLDKETHEVLISAKKGTYRYQLKTANGWSEEIYDALFFSVGHPPYADYYNLVGVENYVHNPYPMKDVLGNLSGNERVGIIGSGASGIDLMRFLTLKQDLKHPMTYYVPSGEIFNFPNIPYEKDDMQFTFTMDWIEANKDSVTGKIPLDLIVDTYVSDIKAGGVDVAAVYEQYKADDLEVMRHAMKTNDQALALVHLYSGRLVHMLPYLFNRLSGSDKQTYMKEYHGKFLFFKARVPNKTFKWLFELMDEGKVRLVEGISEVNPQEDGTFEVVADQTETVDLIINATGFDTNLENVAKKSTLIGNLYNQEFILPHKNGKFVLVDWPEVHVVNQRFGSMRNVFFFGLLIGGTQYENNDAQLTMLQAVDSATWYMDNRAYLG